MRGKAFRVREQRFHDGITPAYAGKSVSGNHPPIWLRDHPRLCGEKVLVFRTHSLRMGSPPPMRGKD